MNQDEVPNRTKLAVFLGGFGAFLNVYAPQAVLPLFCSTFGLSPAAAGLTITATTLAVALVSPFVGVFADRIGRRRIIVPALFLLAIPTALVGAAHSFDQLLVVRFFQGLIVPAVFGVLVAYIGEESKPSQTGSLMGIYSAGTILGGFCGRFLTGVLADAFGWRASFVVIGALLLFVASAVRRTLPEERNFRRSIELSPTRDLLALVRQPSVLATCFVGFAVLFTLVAGFTYANFHLAGAPWHLGPSALASVFMVYLLGLVTTPVAGRLIDRVGPRITVAVAMGTGIAGILLTLVPSVPAIVMGLALLSTGAFVAQICSNVFLVRSLSGSRSTAAGLYYAFYYFGGSFGAFLPGFVWMRSGWTATVFLVAVVQMMALSLAWFAWSKPQVLASSKSPTRLPAFPLQPLARPSSSN